MDERLDPQPAGGEGVPAVLVLANQQTQAPAGFGGQLESARGMRVDGAQRQHHSGHRLATQRLLADPQRIRRSQRTDDHQSLERHAELRHAGRIKFLPGIDVENPLVAAGGLGGHP